MELTGKTLLNIGYPEEKVIGVALEAVQSHFTTNTVEEITTALRNVLSNPKAFVNDKALAEVAAELLKPKDGVLQLRDTPDLYKVYGAEGIEQGAMNQIDTAMRLPIAKAGALMPDAHQGYGLPIGGVLATENAVIPYGVGVDIGCRMCMSIFEIPDSILSADKDRLVKMLKRNTYFGKATDKRAKDHQVLENSLFSEIELLGDLQSRAARQIGSSGGGNHFVEFGVTHIEDENNE